ncbi:PREDICTED: uncharacterized protein LOC108753954 [Trachymyrmex septentrionalis]|uniref:uncharacterized protein LOC108753954 n=1 Tax=Trachymyrmex septentrionalis TaxID=34720 RepID=UPI00084F3971|nr:PREDICTED: uncharacterized protein LOC108753954 [Trachymyrmex septentrionalis]
MSILFACDKSPIMFNFSTSFQGESRGKGKKAEWRLFNAKDFQSLIVLLIVWACETGKHQAQQIGTSIHDVFNVTTDEKIKDELQIFSLQILHCDNTFSAKGFSIDAKLLAAIASNVSVYVTILFQFRNISDSCVLGKTANNTREI